MPLSPVFTVSKYSSDLSHELSHSSSNSSLVSYISDSEVSSCTSDTTGFDRHHSELYDTPDSSPSAHLQNLPLPPSPPLVPMPPPSKFNSKQLPQSTAPPAPRIPPRNIPLFLAPTISPPPTLYNGEYGLGLELGSRSGLGLSGVAPRAGESSRMEGIESLWGRESRSDWTRSARGGMELLFIGDLEREGEGEVMREAKVSLWRSVLQGGVL
ncbi:hypothetical protein P7C70_g4538, partial [Phenoliferia sp. Uapishka_3]